MSTILSAKKSYVTLGVNPNVSALLGAEYEGLEWNDTPDLAAAREAALVKGIPSKAGGLDEWLAPLKEKAECALAELAFTGSWRRV